MNLDIQTTVRTILFISGLLILFSFLGGIRSIQSARQLPFFRMRRSKMIRGWRLLFFALIMIPISLLIFRFAEPVIYQFYPPTQTPTQTPTITLTPTITMTPTITLTPTITNTPSVTNTATNTSTPMVPLAIELEFESTVTPNPDAVFSPLVFATSIDENYLPNDPGELFFNPVSHIYALFTYDKMIPGSQWTALWILEGELVHYESKPWDGQTGGFGYSDWTPDPGEPKPGIYEVQIFSGLNFKVSGQFTVEGDPPTPPPSPTPTRTPIPSRTPLPTNTQRPSVTPKPSATVSS